MVSGTGERGYRNTGRGTTVNSRNTYGRSSSGGNTAYIQGNTVRKPDIKRQLQEPVKKVNHATRKNRERAFYMNFTYVLFLVSALLVVGVVLVGYIRLQSDITNTVKHISALESELNDLKLSNDEEYSRITSSVDLEEIKRIAIGELGMRYAQEGQIITYSKNGSDYVRQFADIPD